MINSIFRKIFCRGIASMFGIIVLPKPVTTWIAFVANVSKNGLITIPV